MVQGLGDQFGPLGQPLKVKGPKVGGPASDANQAAELEGQTTAQPLLDNPADFAQIAAPNADLEEIAYEEIGAEEAEEVYIAEEGEVEEATGLGGRIKHSKALDKATREGIFKVYSEASAVLEDPEASPSEKAAAMQKMQAIETYIENSEKLRKEIISNKDLDKGQKTALVKDLKASGKAYLSWLESGESRYFEACSVSQHALEFILGQSQTLKKLGVGKQARQAFMKKSWKKYTDIRSKAQGLSSASDPSAVQAQISEMETDILKDMGQTAVDFYEGKVLSKDWEPLISKAQAQLDKGDILQSLATLQVAKNIYSTKKTIYKLRLAKDKEATPEKAQKAYGKAIDQLNDYCDELYAAIMSKDLAAAQVHLNKAQEKAGSANAYLETANTASLEANSGPLSKAAKQYTAQLQNTEVRQALMAVGVDQAEIDALIEDLGKDPVQNGKQVFQALKKAEGYINLASAVRIIFSYGKGTEAYEALQEHAPDLCNHIDILTAEVKNRRITGKGITALETLKTGLPKASRKIGNKEFVAALIELETQVEALLAEDKAKANPLMTMVPGKKWSGYLNTAADMADPYKNDSLSDLLEQIQYYKKNPGALTPQGQQKFIYGVSNGKAVQAAFRNIEQNEKMLAMAATMAVQTAIIIIAGATAEFGGGALMSAIPVATESVAGVVISLTATSLIFTGAHKALSVGAGEIGLLPETDWWSSPEEFFIEWGINFAMFALLRGMGAAYSKGMTNLAAKMPQTMGKLGFALKGGSLVMESTLAKALYKTGALATEYAGFVGFGLGTDLVFSDMSAGEVFSAENLSHHAVEDAKMLAGLKIGGALARPVLHPVGQKIMQKSYKPLFDKVEANQKKAKELYEKAQNFEGTLEEAIDIREQQIEVMAERLELTKKLEKKGIPTAESSADLALSLEAMELQLAQLRDVSVELAKSGAEAPVHSPTILPQGEVKIITEAEVEAFKAENPEPEKAEEAPKTQETTKKFKLQRDEDAEAWAKEEEAKFLEEVKDFADKFNQAKKQKKAEIESADTVPPESMLAEAETLPPEQLKKAVGAEEFDPNKTNPGKKMNGKKPNLKIVDPDITNAGGMPKPEAAPDATKSGVKPAPVESEATGVGKKKVGYKNMDSDMDYATARYLQAKAMFEVDPSKENFDAFIEESFKYENGFETRDKANAAWQKIRDRKMFLQHMKEIDPEYQDLTLYEIDAYEQAKEAWKKADPEVREQLESYCKMKGYDKDPRTIMEHIVEFSNGSYAEQIMKNPLFDKLRSIQYTLEVMRSDALDAPKYGAGVKSEYFNDLTLAEQFISPKLKLEKAYEDLKNDPTQENFNTFVKEWYKCNFAYKIPEEAHSAWLKIHDRRAELLKLQENNPAYKDMPLYEIDAYEQARAAWMDPAFAEARMELEKYCEELGIEKDPLVIMNKHVSFLVGEKKIKGNELFMEFKKLSHKKNGPEMARKIWESPNFKEERAEIEQYCEKLGIEKEPEAILENLEQFLAIGNILGEQANPLFDLLRTLEITKNAVDYYAEATANGVSGKYIGLSKGSFSNLTLAEADVTKDLDSYLKADPSYKTYKSTVKNAPGIDPKKARYIPVVVEGGKMGLYDLHEGKMVEGVEVLKTPKGIRIVDEHDMTIDFGNFDADGTVMFHGGYLPKDGPNGLVEAYMKQGLSKAAAEKAAQKNLEMRESVVKQGVVVKVGDNQMAKTGATPPPPPQTGDHILLHNAENNFQMPLEQGVSFKFKGNLEKFEIFRTKDGRYFLRNSKGQYVEIKDKIITLGDGKEGKLQFVTKEGTLYIKDTSTNGVLFDKQYHWIDNKAKAAAIKPLTVDQLYAKYQTEGKNYLQFIQEVNVKGQTVEGIERPLDKNGDPGSLVKLANGKKAVIVGDLHSNIENLNLILKKYAVEIESGEMVLVILGDAVHPEMGNMKDMGSSMVLMDAIIQLCAEGKALYLKGNHDDLMGKRADLVCKSDAKGEPVWQAIEFKKQFIDYQKGEYKKLNPNASQAELDNYGLECARKLQSFYDNAPLMLVADGLIAGHTPVVDSMTLAMMTAGSTLEQALINAHLDNELVMALTWGRPKSQSPKDHPYKYDNADAQSMKDGLGMPDAVIVAGHSKFGSAPAYVTPGIDKGLTLMSFWPDNLSVIEYQNGSLTIEGVKGKCDLNGTATGTPASAAAAQ